MTNHLHKPVTCKKVLNLREEATEGDIFASVSSNVVSRVCFFWMKGGKKSAFQGKTFAGHV